MEAKLPSWVVETATMPIAFAQVREDALLDLELLERLGGNNLRVMMIASGGCTVAALVASGRLGSLHLVDINPAQLALCRLKLHLLETANCAERLALLGHAAMPADRRAALLAEKLGEIGLQTDIFGPSSLVAKLGPDHAGRYEMLFAELRLAMRGIEEEWGPILKMEDADERMRRAASDSALGQAMDAAFDQVMAMENLVKLFGVEATRNSREPFSRHFACQTRHALATLPTADNPYLWQLLIGRFNLGNDGPASGRAIHPWLTALPPQRFPEVRQYHGPMDGALASRTDELDLVHLSNILDWLSPEQVRRTLAASFKALRPGGLVLIRQLNSTLDLPGLGRGFEWMTDVANEMHRRDRSFFYRAIHLGRKPCG